MCRNDKNVPAVNIKEAYFFLTMMKLCRKTYTLIVPKSYKSCGLAVSEEKFFEVSAHQKQELPMTACLLPV